MKPESDILRSNLSQSQLLIWSGQEHSPGIPMYNMLLTFDIRGPVEIKSFISAFEKLVEQSDAMRTVFYMDQGIPMKTVLDEIRQPMEFYDWSARPDKERAMQNWINDQVERPFDLSKRSFEAALIKMGDQRYIWYLNQHHLITDAWSVSVQYKILEAYYIKSRNHELYLVDTLPQFEQYLNYQRENQNNPLYTSAREYWKQKLQHKPQIIRLYGFTHQVTNTSSTRVTINLGLQRSGKLREIAAEPAYKAWTEHLSHYNIFATVLFAFLHRISGQSRLSVGSPAHNRANNSFKNTPGLFIELFPAFVEVAPDISFNDLYSIVRNEINDFLRNALPGTTSPEANKSFQVVLNYIHASFKDFDNMPMDSQWVHPGHCDPGHYLRLQVHDFDSTGNIQLHFDMNAQVFDSAKMCAVPGHFLGLLDAFLQDQLQPITKPCLVSDSEYQALMTFGSGLEASLQASTVIDLFKAQADRYPGEPAIQFRNNSWSYRELDELSNQLANYLIQQKIGNNKRVVLYLNRSMDLILSILAVLKSGAAYVPLDINFPVDRVRHIVDDVSASAIITAGTKHLEVGNVPLIAVDTNRDRWSTSSKTRPLVEIEADSLAYIMYTSGSTGSPKGVMIPHRSLTNYVIWARNTYLGDERFTFPLFTTPAFDLTVTSIFVPIISGGQLIIYPEPENGPDLALIKVIEEDQVDILKLTPSHLNLLNVDKVAGSRIQKVILGGEDLKSSQVSGLKSILGAVEVYNEYGPTEATVGCIFHRVQSDDLKYSSIPIGRPIGNMTVYLLDSEFNPVPPGVTGEIYLAGYGIAEGYWNRPADNAEKFIDCPFTEFATMYRTGDLARWNQEFDLEYVGRMDRQLKIRGIRLEPGEIEATLSTHSDIGEVAVDLRSYGPPTQDPLVHCARCGLPSNYPSAEFDTHGVCNLCRSFEQYQDKTKEYFRQEHELAEIIKSAQPRKKGEYDCLMLLSGGKDSTYALARLVEMGFRVLAFTLDNGYISDQAKTNIKQVTATLKVDHVFGKTEVMNEIFVDSLNRHCNVCNGCFKTIYTLSTNLAVEKGIPFIVTGLSRGQFFETRLTEELFMDDNVDFNSIDQTILQARKAYHNTDDAVSRLLDVSVFRDDKVFDMVQYIDFYRYSEVSLDEMLKFLDRKLPWIRPSDTGRSTNCTINQVGIYEHRRKRGYSNYAFPYSWDVRMGHKTRDASIEEINEEIDENTVLGIMQEIGYPLEQQDPEDQQMVAYYTGRAPVAEQELREYLSQKLPEIMVPSQFYWLEAMPLTVNGKIDYYSLPKPGHDRTGLQAVYKAPESQIEQLLCQIWTAVMQIPEVGINDNFIHLGGNSLIAIRLISRINRTFHLNLPLNTIFESPTIAKFGALIERTIARLLQDKR